MSRVGAPVGELWQESDGDGSTSVRGWPSGPAGVAQLDLLDGWAELLVDVAEPDLLVALRLTDVRHPRSQRLARILLGPRAASSLLTTRTPSGEETILWRRGDDGNVRPLRRGTAPGGLGLIGRLGLAFAEVSAGGSLDRAVAIGLVEAALTAHDLTAELAPRPGPAALLRAGLARWEALADGAFDDVEPVAVQILRRQRGAWAKRAFAIDAAGASSLDRLLDRLLDDPVSDLALASMAAPDLFDTGAVDRAGALLEAAPAAAPIAGAAARDARSPQPPSQLDAEVALDASLCGAGVRVIAAERHGHHLTVHLGGLPDEGPEPWVRVFAAGDRPTLLALAPVIPGDRPWRTAVALIGPTTATSELLVDVTTTPSGPWMGPASRSVAIAAGLGADAARASRRADPSAADRWDRCGSAWAAQGDDRRADLARRYRDDPRTVDPLMADLFG